MIWEIITAIIVTSRGFWAGVGVLIVLAGLVTVGREGATGVVIGLAVLAAGYYVRGAKQRDKARHETTIHVEIEPR